nr:thioesterase domain-containing protein [Planomonospora sphaerica]
MTSPSPAGSRSCTPSPITVPAGHPHRRPRRPAIACFPAALYILWCLLAAGPGGLYRPAVPPGGASGVRSPGPPPLGPGEWYDSLREMADGYTAHIRSKQPTGPYFLAGWSFGGMLAHAIARRLQDQGDDVALLAVIDAFPAAEGAIDRDTLPTREEAEEEVARLIQQEIDLMGWDGATDDPAGPSLQKSASEAMLGNTSAYLAHLPDVFHGDLLVFVAAPKRRDRSGRPRPPGSPMSQV